MKLRWLQAVDNNGTQHFVWNYVGKVPEGLQEAKGFKSGSSGSPELATQTTAKPVGIICTSLLQKQHHLDLFAMLCYAQPCTFGSSHLFGISKVWGPSLFVLRIRQ